MLSDKIEELKCEKCGSYLQRLSTNEELQERYPVVPPTNKDFYTVANQENVKMWMDIKRLWKCQICNEVTEISKIMLYRLSRKYRSLGK